MKKRYLLLLVFILAFGLLAGCGNEDKEPQGNGGTAVSATPAEIGDYLEANLLFVDYVEALDADTAMSIYDLDSGTAKDICVYASSGATAEEIAVVAVSDEAGAETVQAAFEARIEAQKAGFENYVPEELTKLENPVFGRLGDSLIMVICDDANEAEQAIEQCGEYFTSEEK